MRILQRIVCWIQDTIGTVRVIFLGAAIGPGMLFLFFASHGINRISIVNAIGTFCAVIVALFPTRPVDRIMGNYQIRRMRGNKFYMRCVIYNVGKTIVTMGNYDSSITDSGAIVIANIFNKNGEFVKLLKIEMNKSQNRDFSSLRVMPGMAQEYVWDNLTVPRGIDWKNIKIVAFTSNGRRAFLRPDAAGTEINDTVGNME